MDNFPIHLERRLQKAEEAASLRSLRLRTGDDFCSNDYLGFSEDEKLKSIILEEIKKVPFGSSSSRLIRGELEIFGEAEKILAGFCGCEAALIYATGYQANVGLLSSLLRPGDLVFSDRLNHASIIDGIRVSGARKVIYDHLNVGRLREGLGKNTHEDCVKLIVTESLFSMDGDRAPLNELAEVAEEFGALLVVDEAHATGLWGDFDRRQGSGLVQELRLNHRVFATIHPAGKAIGMSGAWICGDNRLKDYLINFSRAFIYSTGPTPVLPVLLKNAVGYWRQVGPGRVRELREKIQFFKTKMIKLRPDISFGSLLQDSPIVSLEIGDNQKALNLSLTLLNAGFEVRAIRPPTVPEGKASLRVTLKWNHSFERLEDLVSLVAGLLPENRRS
jgi:8-amino-7-oxononanoate synthase